MLYCTVLLTPDDVHADAGLAADTGVAGVLPGVRDQGRVENLTRHYYYYLVSGPQPELDISHQTGDCEVALLRDQAHPLPPARVRDRLKKKQYTLFIKLY